MSAREIFDGSDGAATREFYVNLERAGAIGIVAMNLFRAQKCSTRAKKYRGGLRGVGSFRSLAYEKKNWSIDNLALTLGKYGPDLGICFGWKQDPWQTVERRGVMGDLCRSTSRASVVPFSETVRGSGLSRRMGRTSRKRSADRRVRRFGFVCLQSTEGISSIGTQFCRSAIPRKGKGTWTINSARSSSRR